jgi:hypothetical protein
LNSAIFLRLPTSIPKVTYLLVQDQTPGEYKIHDVETSKNILNHGDIQALLDQAAVAVHDLVDVDPIQRITLKVYKAFTYNSHFRKKNHGLPLFSFYTPSPTSVAGHWLILNGSSGKLTTIFSKTKLQNTLPMTSCRSSRQMIGMRKFLLYSVRLVLVPQISGSKPKPDPVKDCGLTHGHWSG